MAGAISKDSPSYYLRWINKLPWKVSDEVWVSIIKKDEVAFEASLNLVEKFIHTYFEQLAEWEEKELEPKEIRRDRKFFAVVDRNLSSKWEAAKIFASLGWFWTRNGCFLDVKNIFSRALWFKEHPYHERCVALLKQRYSSPVEKREGERLGNVLYYLLAMSVAKREIPDAIIDQLSLEGTLSTLPQNETKEEILASWKPGLRKLYQAENPPVRNVAHLKEKAV